MVREDAIKSQKNAVDQIISVTSDQIDSPSRQDTPVHFSKYFTNEDLQQMTEFIENSDEETSAAQNHIKPSECTRTHAPTVTHTASVILPSNSHDPILATITPQSPMMSMVSSGIRNDISIESPNFSSVIAQAIAQLDCDISPAPTPNVVMPVSSPMPIQTPITDNALSDIEPSPRRRLSTRKKDKGRLRMVHQDQWLDVMRKKNKNLGNAYKSRNGKMRKKKEMGPCCGEKCKFKCSQKITNVDRDLLFVAFWSMGDIVRHWDFINKYCDKIPKRRVTTETASRREFTLRYYLPTKIDHEVHETDSVSPKPQITKIQVCKTMFLNTFGIKQGLVYSALKKLSLQGTVVHDKRGIHRHTKKITEEMIASVCDHVNSFAPVESHYVRKRTNKLEIWPQFSDRIQYKTDFCDHEFKCIIVNNALETPKTRSRNRIRLDNSPLPAPLARTLTQAYEGKLPIPEAKLQDLKYLCRNNIIPSVYHDFYMIQECPNSFMKRLIYIECAMRVVQEIRAEPSRKHPADAPLNRHSNYETVASSEETSHREPTATPASQKNVEFVTRTLEY
ncbi:hypothetical protein HW555_010053 [Spodoptera exigua]|uniref:Uncharacterized protein n=1 Tax=Spodoptera exigua TaxID=7107 RepID=A0A835G7T9_SPOEX|nr:hypothetical protein HW555_010053 [Spodoptera exigua]